MYLSLGRCLLNKPHTHTNLITNLFVKNPKELHHWINLLHARGIGPQRYIKLLGAIGSPERILSASLSQLKEAGLSKNLASAILETSKDAADLDSQWLAADKNHHVITLDDDEYPSLLKQIDSPPPVLFIQGDVSLLQDPQLAIVGSRNPTQGGRDNAYEFAKHLAKNGLCITSGLALGVDGFSHKGALDANAPTVSVVATGLDRVYPARHRDLAHAISQQGVLVSEHTIGTPVRAQNFPRRNRIISGLSVGTLVIEAAIKSGSLITARYASEQGREVFAIPGSIHNPLARGCHQLIRQGAKLVETAEHILEEISPVLSQYLQEQVPVNKNNQKPDSTSSTTKWSLDSSSSTNEDKPDPDQRLILQTMGYDPIPIDHLVVQTGLTVAKVSSILLILELQGIVEACGGGQYTRLKPSVPL